MGEQLKTLKARVQHKHKTEANWLKDIYSDVENQVFQTNVFRPLPGELIIYDRDENYDYERYKIGRQDPDEAEGVGLQLHLLEFIDGNINTLTTTNKNIVGAINEINKSLEGKISVFRLQPEPTDVVEVIATHIQENGGNVEDWNVVILTGYFGYTLGIKMTYTGGNYIVYVLNLTSGAATAQSINISTTTISTLVNLVNLDTALKTTDKSSIVNAINEVNGKTIDKISKIDTWYGGQTDVGYNGIDGIAWEDEFSFLNENENPIISGAIYHRIPIMEGENVTFEVDETNQVVKINATGGGSSTDNSMIGTWVFNDEPSLGYLTPTVQYEISFISNGIQYGSIGRQLTGPSAAGIFSIIYEGENDSRTVYSENPDNLHGITNGWYQRAYKFITITEEPTNETIKTWIKDNAKRYEPIGADRVSSIDTYAVEVSELDLETIGNGLTWCDSFEFFEGLDLSGSQITNGTIYHRVPIAGGNNVTIRIDPDTNLARIDSGEYSLGLEYTFHDNYYNVAGMGTCQDQVVRIPPVYNGYPVLNVEDFSNNAQITEVILPNSIYEIYGQAFSDCPYLEKLYIPRSVNTVGDGICDGSNNVTIYCEFSEEEISGYFWDQHWNQENHPVKWNSPQEVFDIADAIDSRLPVTNFTLKHDTPILDIKALADKAGTTPFIIHSKEGDHKGIWIVQIDNAYSDNYYAYFTDLSAGAICLHQSSRLFNSSSDLVFRDFIQEPGVVLTTYSSELSTEDKNLINVVNGLVADVGDISRALESIIAQTNTIIGGTE